MYISVARKTTAPSTWIQKDTHLEGNLKAPLLQLAVPDFGGSPELHHHAVPQNLNDKAKAATHQGCAWLLGSTPIPLLTALQEGGRGECFFSKMTLDSLLK